MGPLIGFIARFGASLSSGMGRLTSMAASNGARTALSGARTAGKGLSSSKGGVSLESNVLDKFVKGQQKLNKLSNRANTENIRYMNKFEQSMLRVERIMSRMSKYSMNMSTAFRYIGVAAAGLSFASINNSIRSHTPEMKFMAGASKTSLAQQRALMQAGAKHANPNMLVNMDYKLGSMAVAALNMPGSKEKSLFTSLGINPKYLSENAGMHRINTLLEAYNRNKSNTEVVTMLSELLELNPAQLDELYKNKKSINQTYVDRLNEVNNETLENLTNFNKRLIEIDQQVENSFTRMTEALAPIITWLEESWGNIKIGLFDGIAKGIKSLDEWINKLQKGMKSFYDWVMSLFGVKDNNEIKKLNKDQREKVLNDSFNKIKDINDFDYQIGSFVLNSYPKFKPKISEAFKKSGWSIFGNKDYDKWFKEMGEDIDEIEEDYKNDPEKLIKELRNKIGKILMKVDEMLKETGEFDDDTIASMGVSVEAELLHKYLGKNGIGAKAVGEWINAQRMNDEERKNKYIELLIKIQNGGYDINSQPENIESSYR